MSDYLSGLPADLLHHLAQVGWLTDRDVVALATTNHANFQTIGSRYERASEHHWYAYFLDDVKLHFQLPGLLTWMTHSQHEHSQPYLFAPTTKSVVNNGESARDSPTPPAASNSSNFVVVLNHTIETGLKKGLRTLPWSSFIRNKEYQPTPHQIGHIIQLRLFAPPVPKPGSPFEDLPRNDEKAIRVPDLSFVPLKSIKHLVLEDSLVHGIESISSPTSRGQMAVAPIFPTKLQTLKLYGATPALFTAELMEHWPISLTSLVLKPDFNSAIYENSRMDSNGVYYEPQRIFFPNHLQTLSLDNDLFGYEPHLVRMPDSLTELWCTPNHPLKNWALPRNLEQFIYVANRRSDDLVHGWKLPSELQILEFTNQFNDPIDKIVFNSKLTRLALGGFNHPLVGVSFPASLTELILGNQFQQTLLGVALPPQLKLLKYGTYLDPYICDPKYFSSLPISLTSLTLGFLTSEAYEVELAAASPQMALQVNVLVNLDYLRLPLHLFLLVEQLPPSLQFLNVGCDAVFDSNLKGSSISSLNRIFASATSLKRLTFDSATISLDGLILPLTLEQLEFGSFIVASLQHVQFGPHLVELRFDHDGSFNQTFEGVQLPSTLKRLTFSYVFDQPMERVTLPDGLEVLRFGHCFNQSLKNVRLPTHLKTLALSCEYDSSLDGVNLPQGLEVFELSEKDYFSNFSHLDSLIHLSLPSNLRTIYIPNPLQKSYQTHPSRSAYQTWVNSLAHSHPYLQLQLTPLNDPHEVDQYHQEEEEEEEEEEEDHDG